jgi:5'-nucleotidase/UDP-sugar diphosphatase
MPYLSKSKSVKITILHTNDHHGRFWSNKDGEYGLAARATLINGIREEVKKGGGEVLLLDAGDVNTGVPQSDLLNAEPDFKGMNAIGYDVMAIGNHEFDNPLNVIKKQQSDWAKFPFISANIYDQNGKRVFPSHITKEINGVKVVIFGLTTEDTPKKSKPEHSKGLTFKSAVEEAKSLVPELRKNADILIALTHTGHYPDEKHGADAPGDVTIARQAKGIDLIVGGHTQKPLFQPDIQNGTIIVQAYEWGKYVGKIDLEVVDGKVILVDYKLIPVNLKDSKEAKIKPDEKIESMLRPYKDQGDKSLLIHIGNADKEFIGKRDVVRTQETNLGNFVAKALKDKFKANIGLLNSGGIRDSLYPGKVTIENVLMVFPFAGEIVTAEMTGEELKKYFEFIVINQTPGSGGFPQMAGVEIVMDKAAGKLKSLKVEGKEVVATKSYVIALPEFVANGGDKYPVITNRKYGYVDADVLKEYIQKVKNLKASNYAPQGYIKFE